MLSYVMDQSNPIQAEPAKPPIHGAGSPKSNSTINSGNIVSQEAVANRTRGLGGFMSHWARRLI